MIQLNNIKKVFQTEEVETWALRNISLEVKSSGRICRVWQYLKWTSRRNT